MKLNYKILLLIIILLAFFLRFEGINYGFTNDIFDPRAHPDEFPIFFKIIMPMDVNNDLNPHFLIHPTLYYYVVLFILKILITVLHLMGNYTDVQSFTSLYNIAPYFAIPVSYISGRLVSILFSTLSVFILFLSVKSLFKNNWLAVLASLLFAIAPYSVTDAHFATADSLSTFLFIMCFYLSSKYFIEKRAVYIIFASVFAGLSASAKYNGILAFLFVFLAYLLSDLKNENRFKYIFSHVFNKIFSKKTIITVSLLFILALVTLLITSPFIILDQTEFKKDFIQNASNLGSGHYGFDLVPDGFIYTHYIYQLIALFPYILGIPLYIISLLGLYKFIKIEEANKRIFLIFPTLAYLIFVGVSPVVMTRYYMDLIPFFCFFAAYFFINQKKRVFNLSNYFKTALFIILILYTLILTQTQNDKMFIHDARYEAIRYIAQNAEPNSIVATMGGFLTPNIQTYLLPDELENSPVFIYNLQNNSKLNVSYILIPVERYYRAKRDKNKYPVAVNFYEDLSADKLGYCKVKSFQHPYFTENIYAMLDPKFADYYTREIDVYKKC